MEKFGEWMRCSPLKKSFGRKFQVPAVAPRAVCALNFSGQQLLKAQAGSVGTPSHTHNTVGTPSHTQHSLACRWRKNMRKRRKTQEEHTEWSCLICELQLLSLFIDTSSQGEHLQGKAL